MDLWSWNKLIASAIAASLVTASSPKADDVFQAVKLDGPFEYFEVLGFITERKPDGNLVDFKPCAGNVITVRFEDLARSQRTCDTEPGGKVVPVSWTCREVGKDLVNGLTAAAAGADPVGTTYMAMNAGDISKHVPGSEGWDNAFQFADAKHALVNCGEYVILPVTSGVKWIGVMEAEKRLDQ